LSKTAASAILVDRQSVKATGPQPQLKEPRMSAGGTALSIGDPSRVDPCIAIEFPPDLRHPDRSGRSAGRLRGIAIPGIG
jgi:hypothetical protein